MAQLGNRDVPTSLVNICSPLAINDRVPAESILLAGTHGQSHAARCEGCILQSLLSTSAGQSWALPSEIADW